MQKLRDELVLVRDALDAIAVGMRQLQLLTIDDEPLRYELYLIFDKNVSLIMIVKMCGSRR